jgi:2-methylisocitrate lyase-like PEP mutase family enzyme
VIITRTDARVIGSLEAALNYAEALILAFADKIFGEAPTSLLGLSS